MNIELRRYRIKPETTDGQIYIDGQKVCDCAEHTPTCLSPGTYPILIHRCKHYRRKMPCILIGNLQCGKCPKMDYCGNNSTLPRYCPQIKIGNGVYKRTDGSIIIGEYLVPGCLTHPIEHFNRLIDRLDKAQNRGESITLTIT